MTIFVYSSAHFIMEEWDIHLKNIPGEEAKFISSTLKRLKRDQNKSVYLVSCVQNKYLYVDEFFTELTGHPAGEFMKHGLEFWLPLIHPEDKPIVMNTIIQGHVPEPGGGWPVSESSQMDLLYRFRRKDNSWVWLCDTKWIVPSSKGIKNYIVGSMMDVSEQKQEDDLRLHHLSIEGTNSLLKVALEYKNATKRDLISPNEIVKDDKRRGVEHLTKREKEILKLIGEGLSSRKISEKLFISLNTVETHRRHLLEKLSVRNSMELIKEAAKAFWL